MSKNFVVLSILFFFFTCMVTAESHSEGPLNLNGSGVLEKLQQNNPEHYQKIQEIIAGLYKQPDSGVPHWIQTTFNAQDISYRPILLTSYPPKRRISFTLDNTHYKAILTLTDLKPLIITDK